MKLNKYLNEATKTNTQILSKKLDVIHQFASNILDNIKDLEPEFSKTVDENFWDLI